jgi:hypothetical protein
VKTLTFGRIVHYVGQSANGGASEERPAIIVRVMDARQGTVNLHVFSDGPNDADENLKPAGAWRGVVHYSGEKQPNTWHWPEEY